MRVQPSAQRISWTGHRPALFRDPQAARAAVERVARELAAGRPAGGLLFRVGGQRGVDTWAALAAVDLAIPFELILPLEPARFTADWAAADRDTLQATLARAARVEVVGGDPAAAYGERNRRLATAADLLVAVWTSVAHGGTAETVAYARVAGTPVREVRLEAAAGASRARGRGI